MYGYAAVIAAAAAVCLAVYILLRRHYREFDSKKQKKSLEALQTLHFFVKFSIFILRLFTSSVII